MLNVGAINAFVVYHNNKDPEVARREFLKNLSQELENNHLNDLASLSNVPVEIRLRISKKKEKGAKKA
jgi:hypothetical protein